MAGGTVHVLRADRMFQRGVRRDRMGSSAAPLLEDHPRPRGRTSSTERANPMRRKTLPLLAGGLLAIAGFAAALGATTRPTEAFAQAARHTHPRTTSTTTPT